MVCCGMYVMLRATCNTHTEYTGDMLQKFRIKGIKELLVAELEETVMSECSVVYSVLTELLSASCCASRVIL